jgi:hypothetical protein
MHMFHVPYSKSLRCRIIFFSLLMIGRYQDITLEALGVIIRGTTAMVLPFIVTRLYKLSAMVLFILWQLPNCSSVTSKYKKGSYDFHYVMDATNVSST